MRVKILTTWEDSGTPYAKFRVLSNEKGPCGECNDSAQDEYEAITGDDWTYPNYTIQWDDKDSMDADGDHTMTRTEAYKGCLPVTISYASGKFTISQTEKSPIMLGSGGTEVS